MKRLRTVEQLDDFLDSHSAKRKKELAFLESRLKHSTKPWESNFYLRTAAALTYAHWEGGVKMSAAAYLEFLNAKGIVNSALTENLLALSLQSRFEKMEQAQGAKRHIELMQLITESRVKEKARFSENLINTGANLNWERFERILMQIGMAPSQYEIESHVVNRLLEWRNCIAHGELTARSGDLLLSKELMLETIRKIRELLEGFRADITNAAANKMYLKDVDGTYPAER